jgi:hypothetical protein
MSKKIIISESQYRRVFLNEQILVDGGYLGKNRLFGGKEVSNIDGSFGDLSAEAFGKFFYGDNSKIKTLEDLYLDLKNKGYDVGDKPNNVSGNQMNKVLFGIVNERLNGLNDLFGKISEWIGDAVNWVDERSKEIALKYYKKHIKNKSDGDKFRKWVYEDNERLKQANDLLKKLKLSGGFSKSGPIDNEHFMNVWTFFNRGLGGSYVNSSGYFPEYDKNFFVSEDEFTWVEDDGKIYPEMTGTNKFRNMEGKSFGDFLKKSGLEINSFFDKLKKSYTNAPEKAGYKKMYWCTTKEGYLSFSSSDTDIIDIEDYLQTKEAEKDISSSEGQQERLDDIETFSPIITSGIVDGPYPLINEMSRMRPDISAERHSGKGIPVFWSYAPIKFYDEQMEYYNLLSGADKYRESLEKQRIEKNISQKNIQGDYSTKPKSNVELFLPFNKKLEPIKIDEYISKYNTSLNHWKSVHNTFNWTGKNIKFNDTFLDLYKFKDVYDGDKDVNNLGTFEEFLEKNPTTLFDPSPIIEKIKSIYSDFYFQDPQNIMSKFYIIKRLQEDKSCSSIGGTNLDKVEDYSDENFKNLINDILTYDRISKDGWGSGCKDRLLGIINEQGGLSEVDNYIEGLLKILDFISGWNDRFLTQKISDWEKVCKGKYVNSGSSTLYSRFVTSLYGPKAFIGTTWNSFCNARSAGGNWIYFPTSKDDYGNTNYIIGCGCVDLKYEKPIGWQKGSGYITSAEEGLNKQAFVDTRPFSVKALEWKDKCKTDYHCWLDIASIALALVGCVVVPGVGCLITGTGLSLAADTINGISYVYEGVFDDDPENDEGWKLNAAFSFLPLTFKTMGTGVKFLKGIQGAADIKQFTNIINKAQNSVGKVAWEGLSNAEQRRLVAKSFNETFKDMTTAQINKMQKMYQSTIEVLKDVNFQKLVKSMKDVPYSKMDDVNSLLTKMSKDPEFAKKIAGYISEGKTFNQILRLTKEIPFKSRFKDFMLQGTLFSLIQFYPEETAKAILSGMEFFQDKTGVPIKKWLGVSTDKNPDDENSKKISTDLEYFQKYSTFFTEVSNYLKNNIAPLLLKYKINLDKGKIEDFIINGKNSLFGEPLENYKNRLEVIDNVIKKKESEGIPYEDIKIKLQELYDAEINYLEVEAKKDNTINLIEKESEQNPPDKDTLKWAEENDFDLENFDYELEY